MALLGWVSRMQGGGEERKSSQLVPAPRTHCFSVAVCVLENWREEGEERERDAGWFFEISVFLLLAAGRQVGGGVKTVSVREEEK